MKRRTESGCRVSVQSTECRNKAKGVIIKKSTKRKKKIRNIIRIKKDKFPKREKKTGAKIKSNFVRIEN